MAELPPDDVVASVDEMPDASVAAETAATEEPSGSRRDMCEVLNEMFDLLEKPLFTGRQELIGCLCFLCPPVISFLVARELSLFVGPALICAAATLVPVFAISWVQAKFSRRRRMGQVMGMFGQSFPSGTTERPEAIRQFCRRAEPYFSEPSVERAVWQSLMASAAATLASELSDRGLAPTLETAGERTGRLIGTVVGSAVGGVGGLVLGLVYSISVVVGSIGSLICVILLIYNLVATGGFWQEFWICLSVVGGGLLIAGIAQVD